jgi:multidrug transporter EmrE-like cation transporter
MWLWSTATTEAHALDKVAEYAWGELKRAGQVVNGTVEPGVDGRGTMLKVVADPRRPLVPLAGLSGPPVTKRFYVLTGRCRYEGVGGTGFLEMWSVLDNQRRFFSRALAAYGPMASLSNASGWREFALPASLLDDPSAPLPQALEFNLHLPSGGTVWLSDLTLSQSDTWEMPLAEGAWWGDTTGGFLGGVLGGMLGCLAGLAGFLSSRPQTRGLSTVLFAGLCGVSAVVLVAGVVAVATGQTYAVWYPLGLVGVLGTTIPGSRLWTQRELRIREEMRRLEATDVV